MSMLCCRCERAAKGEMDESCDTWRDPDGL